VTASVVVLDMGKVNGYDKIMIENQKKRKIRRSIFLHKSPSKRRFKDGIYSLLKRANARISADIIYRVMHSY